MKALVTGFTASMTTGRSNVGFESLSDMLVRGLNTEGHTAVRQPMRVPTNSADLDGIDVLFMGVAPFNALGSRYIYGALDAVMLAGERGIPMVFYISDWQTHLLKTSVKSMLKVPDRFIKPLMKHRTDYEWAVENVDRMVVAMDAFMNRPWPRTLVPTHPWRVLDHQLVKDIPTREVIHIDPTVFTTQTWEIKKYASDEERQREWVLATLGDYTQWRDGQGFQWPVRTFGGATFAGGEKGVKIRVKRKKEWEINENYAEVWGGLVPPYRLSGSGWWRTRYDFILRHGGIVFGDPKEMTPMGEAFTYPLHQLEAMSAGELDQVRAWQNSTFHFEPAEQVVDTLVKAARDSWTEIHS